MMKKLLLSCLFVLAALLSQAQSTYYWVKGSGAWEDINHWSSTSGGTPNKSIIPGPDDDIYFDANSGLVNGTVVTLPVGSHAYCRNMSWVGVTGNATFRTTSTASKYTLYISGSVELASSVAYGMMSIVFNGPTPATFKANGAARVNAAGWYNPLTVDKPGSSLKILGDIPGSFALRNLYLTNGKLDLSGGTHTFGSFISNNNNVREVDITNATMILSTVSQPSTWDLEGTNYTLYATGSYIQTVNFGSNGGNYPKVDITGTDNGMVINGTTFSTLTFTSTASTPGMVRIGMNNIIDQLEFKSHGNIRAGGNQIARLLMAPGKQLLVWGASTITALLRMNAQDCAGLSELLGADSQAALNFGAGATTDLRNVYAKDVTFGGSIVLPVSFQGLDGGGNTGMDIQPLSGGTTMYWVGGAGDWNDQNHWSATSGGTGGYCVPLSADNVIFDANSGFAAGNNTVSTTTNTWCHNMTWTNLSTPVTFTTSAGYTAEVWGSLSLDPNVTMTATLTMKGAEDVTLTTNGSSQGKLTLTITKPVGSVTLTDNFTNPQASIVLNSGKLYMASRKLDIYQFKSNTNNARTIDITNATITTSYNWELTGTGRTWVNNGAGSFITSNDYFLVSGLTYPKVYCTSDLDHFNISGATIDELIFTNPNPLSKADISGNNIIGTLEFKGAGDIRGGGNQIARLLMSPSSINKFAGNNTIKERIRLNSATCSGLGEMRGPGTLNFSPGVTFDLANVYIQNMTATGSGIPIPVTGVDAGGNTGFSITATAGGNRYWIGGSGDWNDPSHWSASSGGPGGACVPTAIDNVFFDANSFTNGSSTVSVAAGNAYCRNMDWTGAGFNPEFNHTTSFSMEIWGNLVMNPVVTMNASPVFKGPSDVTITTNGSGKGSLVISIDKPATNTVRFLDNFINPAGGTISPKSGIVDLTGLTIKLSSISDYYSTGPTTIKITNATINVTEWYYAKSTSRTLEASGSSITAISFYTSGSVYNKVDVQTSDGNKIAISGATITDLLFSNTTNPSGAFINANNTIGRLEFKSSGRITGINNTIGTLIFTPGKIYTFTANTNTTITGDWFGNGTPCRLTEINTGGPGNATVTKTTGTVNFDYVRVKGITAAGITPFKAGEHSLDQGSNVNWSFKPYNSSAPITGLGPDLILCSDKFPYTLTTDGFFGSPMCQYKWNDGSTDPTLVVTKGGTYSVSVTFPDGCSSSGTIKITESKVVVPAITGNLNVCEQVTTLLANTTPGGIWSSNATTVASIDATGLVTGIKAGTADMMYEVTNADGCKASQTATVTVNALPVVSPIAGTTSVCVGVTTALNSTTTGGVWSSNNNAIATVNASGVVTGVAAGTADIIYEVTNANGCKAQQKATVTVKALPVVSPITGTTNVCVGSTTTLNNATTGGTWSSSNTAVATVDANGLVMGVAVGSANIKYEVTNADGCKAQQIATVTVNALPVVSPITGTTSVCVGVTTTLNSTTTGGIWGSSNTAVATIDANGLVTGVSAGTATITYEVTNANGCKSKQAATITVNALPVVSPITGTTSVCVGVTTTLNNTTPGGVWSCSNAAVATIDANGLVTGVSAGTATITYEVTNANGCKSKQTTTVTVNALPVVSPITGTTNVCTSFTTTLSNTTPGGIWSSSNTAVATIDANGLVTGVSAGTSTITYEVTNANGCKVQQTTTVTVNALPVVSPITGTNSVCVGVTITLNSTTPGGIWSSSNTAVATIDANGLVTGVSAGTATITYEVTNANGCKSKQAATITVNALPVVSPITGTTSVCVGVTTTLNSTTPGGVWSSSNTAVATIDATGVVTCVSAGTATITYEVTNANGCKAQQTTTVTVNALPVVTPITGANSVCVEVTTSLNSTTPGGVWSSSNTAVATIDASGVVTGISAGTSIITYEVTNANGCKSKQTATITVNALPVVSPITGTNSVCVGVTTTLNSTTPGGIWGSSNTAVATIDASGQVTGVSAGTSTITYEVTNANGCKSKQTTTVTVNALPVVSPITGTTNVCTSFTTTLSNTTPGGIWSSSNTAVATIDANGLVTGVSAGTSTITYEVTNANGCKTQQTTTVTVNALPVVSPITGTTSVCVGVTTALNSTTPGGVWSSSNTAVATIDASGLVTGVSAGTSTITYEVTNASGCKSQQTATVTVNALPVVSPITGTNNVCIGLTTNLTNTTPGGIWSSSNTAVATIDASGVVTGISAGTSTITYEVTNANGCKAQQTTIVTVNALPVVSPITGATSVCVGVTTSLNSTTPGGIWSSSNTAVATIDANGLVTGVSAGTSTITYEVTNANGCKTQQTTIVAVNALPVVSPITGTTNVCTGFTTSLNNTTPGGVWSSSNTAVATIDANGLVTGVSAGTTTITYEVTNANGCKAQQSLAITVYALPVVSPITGTTNVCAGSSTTLSNTTAGGIWSSSNTAVATIDASGLVTGISAGTATITYEVTNASNCKSQQTVTITVYALPVVSPITGTTSLCNGTTTALSNATPGGLWSSSNTAVATIDANGLVTGVSAGTATIVYEVTNANGCKTQQTAIVTVKALPVVSPITGATTVCLGGTTTLSNNTPGGTWSSNNPNLASIGSDGTVNGVVAGTVIITYQLTAAGCFNSTSITLTVSDCTNTAPPVAQNDVAETYADTPVDINVLNNDSQQNGTINPASVQIVRQPAHGSVTIKLDGTVTYTPAAGYNGTDNFVYTVKNMAGMESNQATVQITILEGPVAVDDDATTSSDKPVSIPVLANDRGKIDPSTVVVTLQPKQGSVTVNADGTITYTPARKYAGKDNFRYQFKDKNGKVSNEATVNIEVEAEELYIPNAITPNNDGKNDRFVIPGISKYPGTTLTIFNRWGNEVYYSPNYDNRWDGTGLSGGTYYYILKLNTGQDSKVYKGWIQLLR
ncbi:Ig-like domain-containing protein [Chitinophaga flava]|uniref:BIG2 domain-containing protein n=1 Tax=Chitinophaga flava TaxID=2259036 RepID=A0A365XSG2_9BACT|nr:Ig-like domain-containing protein [Chitinophaga flava]RBL88664.1 hypothetical protein DF182_19030 [Chitinophaga flava]